MKTSTVGNFGKKIRSDCQVTCQLTVDGGHDIRLESKVEKYFGDHFKSLIIKILNYFDIDNCQLTVKDAGALDYVVMGRVEAAIKQLQSTDKQFLPERKERDVIVKKDSFRRSRLYLPGNRPKFFINAGLYNADGVIFDLEDSVALEKKAEARILVRNALIAGEYYNSELMVRINQLPLGLTDLEAVIPAGVDTILIPKCESAETIHAVEEKIETIKNEHGIKKNIFLMPIIESALGVLKAYEIASASKKHTVALTIGLEDYTADLGVQRTNAGKESEFARNMLINAGKAAKLQVIDSVFSDVSDMDALYETARNSKAMGFTGMGCIHPRQIAVIHKAFAPTEKEIEKAKKIYRAYKKAESEGSSVVSLNSKMIDPPVVKRAQKTIELALQNNLLEANWEEKEA